MGFISGGISKHIGKIQPRIFLINSSGVEEDMKSLPLRFKLLAVRLANRLCGTVKMIKVI